MPGSQGAGNRCLRELGSPLVGDRTRRKGSQGA
jgi:hypothetical protein